MKQESKYLTHEDLCDWITEQTGIIPDLIPRDGVRLRIIGPGRLVYLEVDTFVLKPGTTERQFARDREEVLTETHVFPITAPLTPGANEMEAAERRTDEALDKAKAALEKLKDAARDAEAQQLDTDRAPYPGAPDSKTRATPERPAEPHTKIKDCGPQCPCKFPE